MVWCYAYLSSRSILQIATSWSPGFKNPDYGPGTGTGDYGYEYINLNKDQSSLNSLNVTIKTVITDGPPPPGSTNVYTMWVDVYYSEGSPDLDVKADIDLNALDFQTLDYLKYSHKTNDSIDIDLDVYNWTSQSWHEIESIVNDNSFDNDSFLLNSHFISPHNNVSIRFTGTKTDGSFELYLDMLKINRISNLIDLNSSIIVDSTSLNSNNLKLNYAYRTNISTPIILSIWNDDNTKWDEIDTSPFSSFTL